MAHDMYLWMKKSLLQYLMWQNCMEWKDLVDIENKKYKYIDISVESPGFKSFFCFYYFDTNI